MAFDEASYRREVLEAGLPVREDLRHRYQLPEDLSPRAVAETVQAVRACWRRQRTRLTYRAVIEELEAAHLVHQALFEAAQGGDLAPLHAALAEQDVRATAAKGALVSTLTEAADGLGLITDETRRQAGAVHGVDASRVDAALATLSVVVAAPDPLPRDLPHPAYTRCARHLAVLRLRHLSDFLAAKGPGGRLTEPLRPFTGPGPGEDELEAAARNWGRLPHSAAHTAAQAVAAAARKVLGDAGPEGLQAVLLHELAEPLRARRAARAGARSLLAYATGELSVAPPDARRLVFAVLHEQAADPVTTRLRSLVADGRLSEAVAVLDRLPPDGLPREAGALAAQVRDTLAEAWQLSTHASIRSVDAPDLAWTLLDQAETLVRDLHRIDEVRRSLIVRPVPRVTATADAEGVLVAWEPTPSTAGQPQYVVVRRVGGPPRTAGDGVPLAATPAEGGCRLVDTDAPVNVPVYYGVAVRRAAEIEGPVSDLAVCGPLRYRPEVRAAVVEAADGVVTARWQLPAEARSVRVVDRSGPGRNRTVAAHRGGFTDRELPNGVAHRYLVQVLYAEDDGTVSVSEGIWLTATPLGPPEPVTDLVIIAVAGERSLFEARFEPPHGEVRLYAFDGPPPWPVGQRLHPPELDAQGVRLTARPVSGGLRFRPPRHSSVVLAATVAGDRAVAGARELVVAVPELSEVTAARGPGEAVIHFGWPPDGTSEVEFAWTAPDGAPRRHVVTRLGYLHRGGARLPVADGASVEIEVRPVGRVRGLRAVGAPLRLELPARIEIAYTLALRRLPGRSSVRAVFTSTAPVRVPGLLLVGSQGPSWPLAAGDGETLAELGAVELGPGRAVTLTARLPRGHTSWLRCFAVGEEPGEEAVLVDPPTSRLRIAAGRAERNRWRS
ncbi:hypothetical protein [Streptomyces sp. NBC_00525]|uniref:hypothetical protein n=1 Tax=Streptomyces sp. NBC_00525 TaxID=2903660 RepID=UPI002E7FF24D|nr:hypothetical protein [Streptomyces sp. NBC_00525]WUC93354.1 hypothetical protein OG710_06890 [Streptomyces sp. NBC_00525]